MNTFGESIVSFYEPYIVGLHVVGTQANGQCPFHDDKTPSFSFSLDTGQWFCHAGCGKGNALTFAERKGIPKSSVPKILDDKKVGSASQPSTIEATYDYKDADGNLAYQVVRLKPKSFYQRRPDGKGGWINSIKDTVRVLYRLPELLAVDKGVSVFVVEGEKDANNLWALGFAATTNAGGAGKWQADFSKVLEGRHIVVLPDNDKPGRSHAEAVAASLSGVAASIKIVSLPNLPDKGDVSDWLAGGGDRHKLLELVAQAAAWDSTRVVEPIADAREFFDGKTFRPKLLVNAILRDTKFLATPVDDSGKGVRLHSYYNGVFEIGGEATARSLAHNALGDLCAPERIENVVQLLREETKTPEGDVNQHAHDLIAVKNGMVDWRNGRLLSHDPTYKCTFQLSPVFDPTAADPVVEKFLREVLPADAMAVAEELVGYLLRPVAHHQKAVMLTGSGANGKSTFIAALVALLGERSVSRVSLQDLCDNRFSVAEIQGRLVNVYPDLPARGVQDSSIFKAIVGGESVKAERKNGQPFKLIATARLIFAANQMPATRDMSHGFFRRWLIIPFPHQFSGAAADKDLTRKLTTPGALSTWFNLGLRGLKRLEAQGDFTPCASVIEADRRYRIDSDPVLEFFTDKLRKASGAHLPKVETYEAFRVWCAAQGKDRPLSAQVFNRRLAETHNIKEGRIELGAKRVRAWLDLGWQDDLSGPSDRKDQGFYTAEGNTDVGDGHSSGDSPRSAKNPVNPVTRSMEPMTEAEKMDLLK